MAVYEFKNFSEYVDTYDGQIKQRNPLPMPEPGSIFIGCFMSQVISKPVFAGISGLKFIDSQCDNCELPADAEKDEKTTNNFYDWLVQDV